jgi:hypothetical protein
MAHTNPRRPGGNISGPGGPHDRDSVVIDLRDAVLLGYTEVALVEAVNFKEGSKDPAIAMVLAGRINKTTEHSRILYLMGIDGAAAIISELMGLADRAGPEFVQRLTQRMRDLP